MPSERTFLSTAALSLAILVSLLPNLYAQEKIDSVQVLQFEIKKAGQLLKEKKIVACAESIDRCTSAFATLAEKATAKELTELKKIHAQLTKAHELLVLEGAELQPLVDWDEIAKSKSKSKKNPKNPSTDDPKKSDEVSFSKDLAPWMVEQCGRCHINREQGGFSMASFAAIAKGSKGGVVLFPGDPIGSRLVESIETGDMPRGGGKVSAENLDKLKKWVTAGAKFDGTSAEAPLASLGKNDGKGAATTQPKPPEMTEVKQSTGKETVSFARDVAPLLTSNCNGCHYQGMRNSGGLQFNTFVQILKGGDSGAMIQPGKSEESLLIKKLRGTAGQRMPAGRPALSEENIKLISTWIDEGATFDGASRDARLDQVIGQAWASKANHEELMNRRISRAKERWKTVSPKIEADEAQDNHFHVIGNVGPESTKKLLELANSAEGIVKKQLRISSKEPLIKGGVTIFALKQRYDYSEFGTMLESRSIPADWSSHWKKEVLDAYVCLVYDKNDPKINESTLVQQLASLWIAQFDGVPKWFADGAGRQVLATTAGVNDARVQSWINRLPASMNQLQNLQPFLKGDINDEDSATIGFGIVHFMNDSQRKKQYDALIRSLASGSGFEQSVNKNIGPLEPFLQQLLGKNK